MAAHARGRLFARALYHRVAGFELLKFLQAQSIDEVAQLALVAGPEPVGPRSKRSMAFAVSVVACPGALREATRPPGASRASSST
jgi:hypothetical protein